MKKLLTLLLTVTLSFPVMASKQLFCENLYDLTYQQVKSRYNGLTHDNATILNRRITEGNPGSTALHQMIIDKVYQLPYLRNPVKRNQQAVFMAQRIKDLCDAQ